MPPRTSFARSRVEGHLDGASRATIQRPEFSDGGTQTTWPVVQTNVPVTIGAGRATEVVREGRTVSIIAIPLVFAAGTNVQAGDQVVIGARTFQVLGLGGPGGTVREVARVVTTEEIT